MANQANTNGWMAEHLRDNPSVDGETGKHKWIDGRTPETGFQTSLFTQSVNSINQIRHTPVNYKDTLRTLCITSVNVPLGAVLSLFTRFLIL